MRVASSSGESLLSGTYIYGMDRKGRVVLPAPFRQLLGSPFVLTRAPGQALLALSIPQWRTLVSRYEESVLFRGYYLAAAVQCRVDETTSRFLVPHALRDHAELSPGGEVAVTGVGRAVQVWQRARWDEAVRSGEFGSLGQLDLELEVPLPLEAAAYRQRSGRPLGLPLVECRGRLDGRAVRRLAGSLLRLLEERPPVIVLDVRATGETQAALALLLALLQPRLEESGAQVWLIGSVQPIPGTPVTVLPDLDTALWRLAEGTPRDQRGVNQER